MNGSTPGPSVHEISRQEHEWVAISPPGDLSDPEIKPESPALAGGFLITEPPEKPT